MNASLHKKLYIFSLILFGVCLPISYFGLSVAQLLLSLNYIVEGRFKEKYKKLISNRALLIALSVYLLHLVGLLYTQNFEYAFHDLRIKLPYLVVLLIIGTSELLNWKEIKLIISFFNASVLVSSLICFFIYKGFFGSAISDHRNISVFIYHIHFSVHINITIFSTIYFLFQKPKKIEIYFYYITILWLSYFLFVLNSLTGITVFIVVVNVFLIRFWINYDVKLLRYAISLFLAGLLLIIVYCFGTQIQNFYNTEKVDFQNLETHTINGNKYTHLTDSRLIENGHYVWIYYCPEELKKEWNGISEIKYPGTDKLNQQINNTLIRYLTSKGLRKDSVGVSQLSKHDIKNIENGIANYKLVPPINLQARIYQVIWEFDVYFKGGYASGHSVTQRIEFWKTGLQIARQNIFIGVGTGDVQDMYNEQYIKNNSTLSKERRLRSHNQYLTFLVSFGVIGLCWIIFAWFYPVVVQGANKSFLFNIIFLISLLPMLVEDYLEVHTGISFFSFFYALFVFGTNYYNSKNEN